MSTTCLSPYYLKEQALSVPCGKCEPCLLRRVSGWSFRLVKEGVRTPSFFVTYTYDTASVPLTPRGFMSLDRRVFPAFMKRLRKSYAIRRGRKWDYSVVPRIRYYLCGEYGSKGMRPHYHAIMFADLSTAFQLNDFLARLQSHWTYGGIFVGHDCSAAAIGYTLKYMMKPSKIPLHKNDDRIPEFQLCSKRLGMDYLTPSMRDWHRVDLSDRYYIPLPQGGKIAMPRYYKEKIYSKRERQLIGAWLQASLPEKKDLTGQEEKAIFDRSLARRHRLAEIL